MDSLLTIIESDLQNVIAKIALFKKTGISLSSGLNIKNDKEDKKPETSVKSSSYKCDECNNIFDENRKLKRHKLRVHSEKKFECEDYYKANGDPCLAKFSTAYALKKHLKKHEKNEDEKEAE